MAKKAEAAAQLLRTNNDEKGGKVYSIGQFGRRRPDISLVSSAFPRCRQVGFAKSGGNDAPNGRSSRGLGFVAFDKTEHRLEICWLRRHINSIDQGGDRSLHRR